jgi:hypothetical protein
MRYVYKISFQIGYKKNSIVGRTHRWEGSIKYILERWDIGAMLGGSLSPWHGTSSGCGWRRRPSDMEGSCKYTEQAVANSKGQFSSLGIGHGVNNPSL